MNHTGALRVGVAALVAGAAIAVAVIAFSPPDTLPAKRHRASCGDLRKRILEKVGRPTQLTPSMSADERFAALQDVAHLELDAKHLDQADALATELLAGAPRSRGQWNYGNALHHGHTIRGLVALAHGDLAAAREHLRLSAEVPGSPQLDSFGPNMSLAEALLERGDASSVLAYLERCRRFWKKDHGQVTEWESAIVVNRIPDFNANLCY